MIFASFKRLVIIQILFVILIISLSGCKKNKVDISMFDDLPESKYLTQVKGAIENKTPMVIAFTAEWCPHCREYKPKLQELEPTYENKVSFIHIDIDDKEGSSLSEKFKVNGIPTTAFVRTDGSVFKIQVGEIDKEGLIKTIDDLVKSKKKKKGDPVDSLPDEANASPDPKTEPTIPSAEEDTSAEEDESLE